MESPAPEGVMVVEPPAKRNGCDTILFRDGSFELVNLVKLSQESVSYIPCGGGPTYDLSVERILAIHHSSGTIQEFGNAGGNESHESEGGLTASTSLDLLRKKADKKSWIAFGLGLVSISIPLLGLACAIIAMAFWFSARTYYRAEGRTTAASFGLAGFLISLLGLFDGLWFLAVIFL